MSAEIGAGTILTYGGMGVVLHQRFRIGKNVVIAHRITVGGRSGMDGVPVIEDNSHIGVSAKFLGPIRIDLGSGVGANAVVSDYVPPRSIVIGARAKVMRVAVLRGCDVDQPRNLAKSVTVE